MVRWRYLLVLLVLARADMDWSNCLQNCRCKWISGRKGAECTNFIALPDGLSSEIQILDLTGSRLPELPRDAFRLVNLINLHKLFLRDCGIECLHKEALCGLSILIELDLSLNLIHSLHPSTFRENVRLRILSLSRNPIQKLTDGLFANLTFLQTVEVSDCQLLHVGRKTFINVPQLKTLILDGNNLTTMQVGSLESLEMLNGLVLHNNPWKCDCHLQAFRDWTIERNLYAQPTSCSEPPVLHGKLWSDLSSGDFACRPQIIKTHIQVDSSNVTFSCQVKGSPPPQVHWEFNSRIIHNYSRTPYVDQRYLIAESQLPSRWVNLTVSNVRPENHGDYICVARNRAGIDERNVTLIMNYELRDSAEARGSSTIKDSRHLIGGLVSGVIFVIAVTTYCYLRRRRNLARNKVAHDGTLFSGAQDKYLFRKMNPVSTAGGEIKTNNELMFLAGGSEEHIETNFPVQARTYPPDLLKFPSQLNSTSSSAVCDCQPPVYHSNPAFQSSRPFSWVGPLSQGYVTIPRRIPSSCPFSCINPTSQGYITIPRRKRVASCTSSTTDHDPPSPVYHSNPGFQSSQPFSCIDPTSQGYVTIPRRKRVPSCTSSTTDHDPPSPVYHSNPGFQSSHPFSCIDPPSQGYVTIPRRKRVPSCTSSTTDHDPPSPVYHSNPGFQSSRPFSCIDPPSQDYITISRCDRVPSWNGTPTTIDPLFQFELMNDNLGLRTTAEGNSISPGNTVEPTNQIAYSTCSRQLPSAAAVPGDSVPNIIITPCATQKQRLSWTERSESSLKNRTSNKRNTIVGVPWSSGQSEQETTKVTPKPRKTISRPVSDVTNV
ncbi:hypothetical protein L9F63_014124 [Diploptera punctata]|uniref:Ig-like domain-containing protein n=1 Tax=Diploptera punctata TaxID=6984 RepID=A0AAD8A8J4_DIPPU|nr:hypothetical protein L9F63_014124 [Diploptera punctata]